jgi:hypothetical protein
MFRRDEKNATDSGAHLWEKAISYSARCQNATACLRTKSKNAFDNILLFSG